MDRNSPIQSFPPTSDRVSDYNRTFSRYLQTSSTYNYLGATGLFAAYRLFRLQGTSTVRSLHDIKIVTVDPGDVRALEAVSHRVRKELTEVRQEILFTLTTLFDLRAVISSEVALVADLISRRLELLDEVVFETLYVGDSLYPSTEVYVRGSRRYQANLSQIHETVRFGSTFRFGSQPASATGPNVNTEPEFHSFLADVGYRSLDLEEVRVERDAQFAELDDQLRIAGIAEGDLF